MLVQSMAFKQVHQLFAQFGMTPAARTRVAVNPQTDLFAQSVKNGDKASAYIR